MPNQPARLKILIVDDERDLVDPLVLRLEVDGRFLVETAYDGRDGLRKALSNPPDAALIDLDLPGIDGWELCRRLHEHTSTRRTRVVLMTAWEGRDLTRRATMAGVFGILLKPFEESAMVDALAGPSAPKKEMSE